MTSAQLLACVLESNNALDIIFGGCENLLITSCVEAEVIHKSLYLVYHILDEDSSLYFVNISCIEEIS